MRQVIACIIVGVVFCGGISYAAGPPFEPEVSATEGRLLQAAIAVGETNAVAAAQMLETGERRGPALAFAAGNFLFQAGAYEAAQVAYEEAIGKLPRFRAAKANLGRIYLLQEQPRQAMRLYQELVADGQADADIYLLLGHALQMEGRSLSAETAFRNALLLAPDHQEAMTGLLQALFAQARYAEALLLTSELVALQPDKKELWRLRANTFMHLGQYAEAIQTVEMAKRLALVDGDMLALQGDLLLHANQAADALYAYRAAHAADGLSAERLLRAVEGFLLLGDSDRAEEMLGTLDAAGWEDRERAPLVRLQAELRWQRDQVDAARELAQQALQLDPLDGHALLLLATIAESEGQVEAAILYCERAARLPDFEVDALVRQAQIEVGRQRYADAIVLLETAQVRREQAHIGRYLEQLRRMQM